MSSEPIRRQMQTHFIKPDKFTMEPMRKVTAGCPFCGNIVTFTADSVVDSEVEAWKERYNRLAGSLNDVVKKVTHVYGVNPMMVMLADELIKLRDRFGDDL